MTGYSVTLIVGLGLIVIGVIVLFFLPQRAGGIVKAFTVEVNAPGAGVVLIIVGVGAMAWSAPQVPQIVAFTRSTEPTQTAPQATVAIPLTPPPVVTLTLTSPATVAASRPTQLLQATQESVAPTSTVVGAQSQLTVRVVSPANGDTVSGAVPIRGILTGTQGADQHLWIFIHPEDGSTNWWPHPDELRADAGEWQVTVNLTGPPPGMRSELHVGVIGKEGQDAILRHLREQPEAPLQGLPPGFSDLAYIFVINK